MDEKPEPVWTDGIGCIYHGQRVGWHDGQWNYGVVLNYGLDMLKIERDDGIIILYPPSQLA